MTNFVVLDLYERRLGYVLLEVILSIWRQDGQGSFH